MEPHCHAMMRTKEDLVPGGRWVSVPGTDARSSLYAFFLAMATNSSLNRAPIWDPRPDPRFGTRAIEVLDCTLLKAVWEGDVILRSPEFLASQPSELLSILAISVDKLKLTSAPSLASSTRDPFATHQYNDTSDTD
ncbi:hypothetical protein D6D04_06761 [Aureobasidium pullulans]|nr:hypothetical protein D6D04_06761 [Aureobasidium pullulans]